ncbi:MAG: hypothetical protein V5A60_15805, partial [Haloarculaceae archaeon]
VEEGLDVPVVVTGGTSSPQGFAKLFQDRLNDAAVPFSISDVRRAEEPMYSVARGALVASRTEEAEDEAESEAAVDPAPAED